MTIAILCLSIFLAFWSGLLLGVRYHAFLHGSIFETSYCNCGAGAIDGLRVKPSERGKT